MDSDRGSGTRRLRLGVTAGLVLIVLAACSATGSTPSGPPEGSAEWPSALQTESPIGSASLTSEPTASFTTEPSASPIATPTSSPATPKPTPTPSPTLAPLTSAAPIPEGTLSGIQWYPGPLISNCESTVDADGYAQDNCPTFSLWSWSKGYVLFEEVEVPGSEEDYGPVTVISVMSSADGLHWTKVKKIYTGYETIVDVVEGAGSLLAVANTTMVGTCGGPDYSIDDLWQSYDAVNWSRIPFSVFGNSAPDTISGSSRGFVATGGWSEPYVWISADGRTWTQPALPFAIYRSATVRGPVAFSGGFIVYGQVIEPGGCGGDWLWQSAVWFSANGTSWARELLPGSQAAPNVTTWVGTMTDTVLLATETITDDEGTITAEHDWTSLDGQTWNVYDPAELKGKQWSVYGSRDRALVAVFRGEQETPIWYALGTDLHLTRLLVSGPDPWLTEGLQLGLGPTGLLAFDGNRIWIGVLVP